MSVLYRQWIRSLAQVTDAEARDYFEKNAVFIRTRFHVLQILHRGNPADVARDGEDARRGTPFEEIAARRFPSLPEGPKAPWDLGELYWHQIPPAWRGVVDRLEPGQISGVIEGPGDRRWIVKLAGKTVDPAIGFEGEKEMIVAFLREQRAQEIEERMLRELKASAVVVYSR